MTDTRPPIDVHLLCGFLGSGKTTRINTLIANGELEDALFLVNDFGSLNIDASLIESREGEVVRLSNGCACCGLAGNLSLQLRRIRHWPKPPVRLVMEASGVARPRPLAQLFRAAPGYALAQLDLLVDASMLDTLLKDPCVGELVRDQLRDVERISLNRWHHMEEDERRHLVTQLAALNPHAVLQWDEAPSEPLEVMGPGETDKGSDAFEAVSGALASLSIRLPGRLDSSRLAHTLNTARPFLLRAKGFIRSREAPDRITLVQWTPGGCRFTPAHGDKRAVLVLIGKGRENLEALAERLSEMSATASLR